MRDSLLSSMCLILISTIAVLASEHTVDSSVASEPTVDTPGILYSLFYCITVNAWKRDRPTDFSVPIV